MKVLMICIGLPTEKNPSRGVFNLRTAMQIKQECDIELIFLRTWTPFKPIHKTYYNEGLKIHELRLLYIPFLSYIINIWIAQKLGWFLIKKHLKNVDILHTVSAEYSSILGSYWSKKSGIKHVAQLIGSDINAVMPVIKDKAVVRDWIHNLSAVVCNSAALKDAFHKLYPSFSKPVVTLYRGTNINRFTPPLPDNRLNEITCLYVGGFADYGDGIHKTNLKGGYTVTGFWQKNEVALKKLNIKLHLAGRHVVDNNNIRKWHAQLIHKEQVKLSPLLSNDLILEAYQHSLILLLPSKQEGLPNAGVEAASCGCVIIGNNVGGIPEIVEHNQSGIIIMNDKDEAWGEILLKLVQDENTLKKFSTNARKKAEVQFNSAHYGRHVLTIYKSILE